MWRERERMCVRAHACLCICEEYLLDREKITFISSNPLLWQKRLTDATATVLVTYLWILV